MRKQHRVDRSPGDIAGVDVLIVGTWSNKFQMLWERVPVENHLKPYLEDDQ